MVAIDAEVVSIITGSSFFAMPQLCTAYDNGLWAKRLDWAS